jgi:hypothetical protein
MQSEARPVLIAASGFAYTLKPVGKPDPRPKTAYLMLTFTSTLTALQHGINLWACPA